MTGASTETDIANRGDLAQVERGVLRFERADRLTHRFREATMIVDRRLPQQACQAQLRERCGFAIPGAAGGAGLAGPFDGGLAKENDRPNQLVGFLLGPGTKQTEPSPLVGQGMANALTLGHRSSIQRSARVGRAGETTRES